VAVPRPPRAVATIVSTPFSPRLVNVKGARPEGSVFTAVGVMSSESGPVVTAKVTGAAAAGVPSGLTTVAVTVCSSPTLAVSSGGVIVMVGDLLVPDAKS
jgi:ABC-type xylose transport system permease subunit